MLTVQHLPPTPPHIPRHQRAGCYCGPTCLASLDHSEWEQEPGWWAFGEGRRRYRDDSGPPFNASNDFFVCLCLLRACVCVRLGLVFFSFPPRFLASGSTGDVILSSFFPFFPCHEWSLVFGRHHSPSFFISLGTESMCCKSQTYSKQCVGGTARRVDAT